jgi:hypothetical protein
MLVKGKEKWPHRPPKRKDPARGSAKSGNRADYDRLVHFFGCAAVTRGTNKKPREGAGPSACDRHHERQPVVPIPDYRGLLAPSADRVGLLTISAGL